ncbi:MAG: cytochrome c-type biogenesis protein CcmH [Gammaproteobacteria bacterium]|jgi:cytochrome c-type biogenesis protein CcmH
MLIVNYKNLVMFLFLLVAATTAVAKQAAPLADDPELEKKVNNITKELRCLVCQNQTIADSHADLAIDLKNQVREMVRNGKTRDDVVDYMVARYGDFVRYRPPIKPTTYLLWSGPFLLLVGGLLILGVNLKRRRAKTTDSPLSEEEHHKLESILHSDNKTSAATGGEDRQ